MSPGAQDHVQGGDLRRTLAPTMLIGIGGTGTDVLLRVRRLFYERYGRTGFPIVGYLSLDTNKDAFSRLEGEGSDYTLRNIRLSPSGNIPEALDCSITQGQFEDYFRGRERQHPHVFAWMPGEMDRFGPGAIVGGAGQNRPFGRLGFFHHFSTIKKTLKERIQDIVTQATLPHLVKEGGLPKDAEVDPLRLEVVVVYSLAGGTGAGMFLDVALLTRQVVSELHLIRVQPHFTHYAVLPEGFVQKVPLSDDMKAKIQENAFTCLREMEYFSMKRHSHGGGPQEDGFDLSIPSRLPPVDEPKPASEPLYTVQWDRDGAQRYECTGAPWDVCYLVGAGNDLMQGSFLSPTDLDQMIAERLFLDFDPSRFGEERRPLDVNLLGGTLSRMPIKVPTEQGQELYQYFVSRRFSIFGLSQIYFDRARMRRAASYRLAARLVEWWLRPGDLSPSQLRGLAVADLHGADRVVTETHEDGDPLLALSYDALRHQILLEEREANRQQTWWTKLNGEIEKVREQIEDGVIDPRGPEPLTGLIAEHEKRMEKPVGPGEPGIALKTFRRNRELLAPEINRRVRCLFRYRLRQHGVRGALQMFTEYAALTQRELQLAQKNQAQPPVRGAEWSARLREARRVPLFYSRPAARIELLRGLSQVEKYLAKAYHYKAVPEIRACLERLHRCLAVKEEREGSYYNLLVRFQQALDSHTDKLEGAQQFLARNFGMLSKQDVRQTRTVGLLAKWDEQQKTARYDDLLKKLVPLNTHDDSINWLEMEQLVLGQLRGSGKPEWAEVKSLGDVAMNLLRLEGGEPPAQQVVLKFCRDLAEACESLLKGFAKDISALMRFDDEPDAREKDRYLETLRLYSAPFLQKSGAVDLPLDAVKSSVLLLGIAHSGSSKARDFRQRVVDSAGGALTDLAPFDTQDDAIVLYQEKAGVPLCFYAGLDHLGAQYDKSNRKRETYFDHPALKGKLPEIRKINQRKEMASCVEPILFGIMTRLLRWEKKNFWLTLGGPGQSMARPLGGGFEDVIRQCSATPRLLEQLQDQFRSWREEAARTDGGERLAIMWCAVQDLHEEIRSRVEERIRRAPEPEQVDLRDHPLLAILGNRLLPRLTGWLEGLRGGRAWLDSPLDLHHAAKNRLDEDEERLLRQQRREMLRGCYEVIDEDRMPIPVLNPDARLRRPEADPKG